MTTPPQPSFEQTPPPNNSIVYVVVGAVTAVAIATLGAMSALLLRGGSDAIAVLTPLAGFAATVIAALLGLVLRQQQHTTFLINSRMSELLRVSERANLAEGRAQGRTDTLALAAATSPEAAAAAATILREAASASAAVLAKAADEATALTQRTAEQLLEQNRRRDEPPAASP